MEQTEITRAKPLDMGHKFASLWKKSVRSKRSRYIRLDLETESCVESPRSIFGHHSSSCVSNPQSLPAFHSDAVHSHEQDCMCPAKASDGCFNLRAYRRWRRLSCALGFLHLRHRHAVEPPHNPPKDVPKGFVAVSVGEPEEEQTRFVIPVFYFNHPRFLHLLKKAEHVYGFDQKGVFTIPCRVAEFEYLQWLIDTEESPA